MSIYILKFSNKKLKFTRKYFSTKKVNSINNFSIISYFINYTQNLHYKRLFNLKIK